MRVAGRPSSTRPDPRTCACSLHESELKRWRCSRRIRRGRTGLIRKTTRIRALPTADRTWSCQQVNPVVSNGYSCMYPDLPTFFSGSCAGSEVIVCCPDDQFDDITPIGPPSNLMTTSEIRTWTVGPAPARNPDSRSVRQVTQRPYSRPNGSTTSRGSYCLLTLAKCKTEAKISKNIHCATACTCED